MYEWLEIGAEEGGRGSRLEERSRRGITKMWKESVPNIVRARSIRISWICHQMPFLLSTLSTPRHSCLRNWRPTQMPTNMARNLNFWRNWGEFEITGVELIWIQRWFQKEPAYLLLVQSQVGWFQHQVGCFQNQVRCFQNQLKPDKLFPGCV